MNIQQLLQHCLLAVSMTGAAVCLAAVLAYRFRNQLRALHERWLGLGPFGRVVSVLAVTVAVLYGSTKSPTNDLAGATGTGATGTLPVAAAASVVAYPDGQDARRPSAYSPMMAMSPQLTHQITNQLTNWTRRGAYSDWHHIDFPPAFAFPHGTNLLASITLFAWGEIRESLHQPTTNNQQLTTLPTAVSLEPGSSSVTYGLTPSNTFLVSWQNACVNRSPTNRIDASIELFASGAILITTQPTNQPTNKLTNYLPPTPPEGFVGSGQDTNWLAATFSPSDYAVITNKGYARWLNEDYVGYNEENGHCRGTVTVHSMPPDGQPCYLVCGPHKVIVTEPGDYDFPVNVLTDYHIRTYPTDVPVSFSYDEGYYSEEDDYGPLLSSPNRRLLGSPQPPSEIIARIIPSLRLTPSHISFSDMANRHIRIWCNMAQAAWEYVTLGPDEATLRFHNRHEAEIVDAMITRGTQIVIRERTHEEIQALVSLLPPVAEYDQPTTNTSEDDSCETNRTSSASEP